MRGSLRARGWGRSASVGGAGGNEQRLQTLQVQRASLWDSSSARGGAAAGPDKTAGTMARLPQ